MSESNVHVICVEPPPGTIVGLTERKLRSRAVLTGLVPVRLRPVTDTVIVSEKSRSSRVSVPVAYRPASDSGRSSNSESPSATVISGRSLKPVIVIVTIRLPEPPRLSSAVIV